MLALPILDQFQDIPLQRIFKDDFSAARKFDGHICLAINDPLPGRLFPPSLGLIVKQQPRPVRLS
jgi:hypothetical protein